MFFYKTKTTLKQQDKEKAQQTAHSAAKENFKEELKRLRQALNKESPAHE